ncbi:MAG: hypothetical protein HN488_05600, partial [Saprospiraceae bacterium]|nr:hypothetical protein [Saprospiraceae bacterium]
WGGKTTYTYGLNHVSKFAGFMPIGAATSVNDLDGIADQSFEKPYYIIHGENDNPNVRFYPMVERLLNEGALVESNLLPGVGHTIWFPNQVEVLTDGYIWLKENSASIVDVENQLLKDEHTILLKENYMPGMSLIFSDKISGHIDIYTLDGTLIASGSSQEIKAPNQSGIYIASIGMTSQQFVVTE